MSADRRESSSWRSLPTAVAFDPRWESAATDDLSRLSRMKWAFWVLVVALLITVAVRGDAPEDVLGAALIVVAGLAPAYLWLQQGARALPIMSAVAAMHILYFAFPLISNHPELFLYDPGERLAAAATVVAFLVAATVACSMASSSFRFRETASEIEGDRLGGALVAGLLAGLFFHYLTLGGYLGFLGEWYGIVRAFALNLLLAVTFLVGVLKGKGALNGAFGMACVSGVLLNVMASWASLFLVGGIILWAVFVLGYVLGSRRVPIKEFLPVFLLAFVLHAGKSEMREKYWIDGAQSDPVSMLQMPERIVEWIGAGVAELTSEQESAPSILERASLMQMLLRAQEMSPDPVPFLGGETYAQIPRMLVPRVLDPDKPASQAGMDLLNIRYGILTAEGAQRTAVGWGLLSEAYANFGVPGVLMCGVLLGVFIGFITGWTSGAPPLSARTMLGIVVTAVSVSLEADSASYITSLFQAAIAVFVLSHLLRALGQRLRSS